MKGQRKRKAKTINANVNDKVKRKCKQKRFFQAIFIQIFFNYVSRISKAELGEFWTIFSEKIH